jgi:hypothetical protein
MMSLCTWVDYVQGYITDRVVFVSVVKSHVLLCDLLNMKYF